MSNLNDFYFPSNITWSMNQEGKKTGIMIGSTYGERNVEMEKGNYKRWMVGIPVHTRWLNNIS
jgi:hypothetical protein